MFETGIPFVQRMDEVIKWMTVDSANFVLLYINEPDVISHQTGPFSPEVRKKLSELDDAVQHLVTRLDETGLSEETNLIILSDHGMTEVREDRVIDLKQLFDLDDFIVSGDSPVLNLFFLDKANMDKVYGRLLEASKSTPFRVWRRGEVPAEYHYNAHRRIGELVLEADEGYEIEIKEGQFVSIRRDGHMDGNRETLKKMDILQKFDDFLERKNKTTMKVDFQAILTISLN